MIRNFGLHVLKRLDRYSSILDSIAHPARPKHRVPAFHQQTGYHMIIFYKGMTVK